MRTSFNVTLAALVATAVLVPAVAFGAMATATGAQPDDLECEYPLTITDATGEEVTIDEPPESIVALQPSDVQLVAEIGAADRLVGMPVTQYTEQFDVPGDVEDVSQSGDDVATPSEERVIDLEPDVVLAANAVLSEQTEGLVEQLRDAGLTVYVFESAASIDDVRDNVRITGSIVDDCDGAAETVEWMDDRLAIVEEAVADEEHPLAYYVMFPGSAYTPGTGTFQHEVLETAGVENVAERAGISGWGEISGEVVVEENPEWLIYHDDLTEPPASETTQATTAWQNDQFVTVDDNAMSQPGPQVVNAIETIAQTVHPEAYEAAAGGDTGEDGNETGADDGADGDDTGTDDGAGDGDDAEDETIPGFGVVPALVAVVAGVFGLVAAARRR